MAEVVSFNHVGHCVADLAVARRFYEELLGFVVERELSVPDAPAAKLLRIDPPLGLRAVYLRRDAFVLELVHYDRPGNPPVRERAMNEPGLTHLSFTVGDIASAVQRVPELGGTVLADTDVGAAVFIRDPDGQLIELIAGRLGAADAGTSGRRSRR